MKRVLHAFVILKYSGKKTKKDRDFTETPPETSEFAYTYKDNFWLVKCFNV